MQIQNYDPGSKTSQVERLLCFLQRDFQQVRHLPDDQENGNRHREEALPGGTFGDPHPPSSSAKVLRGQMTAALRMQYTLRPACLVHAHHVLLLCGGSQHWTQEASAKGSGLTQDHQLHVCRSQPQPHHSFVNQARAPKTVTQLLDQTPEMHP